MILNENKVNNETKNIVTDNEQSTTLSNNNQHLQTSNYNLFIKIKNYFFKNAETVEIGKANNETTELKKSKNINIEVNQIDNEIVLKCLSDRFFFLYIS